MLLVIERKQEDRATAGEGRHMRPVAKASGAYSVRVGDEVTPASIGGRVTSIRYVVFIASRYT